jgi:cytochrome c
VSGLRAASVTAFALAASLLLARVHPFGDAGLYKANSAPSAVMDKVMEHASVPAEVRSLLVTKCADCHSDQTHSPLYSRFAPVSWLMERDIVEGRKHMNLSQWLSYSDDQKQTFQARIVQETKSNAMPLPQYRMIHWNARITPADQQVLTQWTRMTFASADNSMAQATAEGDSVRGKAVFEKRCTGCHALNQNREGPMLDGVYGRNTGAVPGFPYSDALKKANIVWNDQTLEKWLTDPDAFLPGNNMDFQVAKPQERKDLVAYFKQSAGK